MAKRALGQQIYVRPADKARIEKLAQAEYRSVAAQFELILNEALERRGLDPKTLRPVNAANAGARCAG